MFTEEEEDEARVFNNDIRRVFDKDDEEEEEGNSSKSVEDVAVEFSNKPEDPKSDNGPIMQRYALIFSIMHIIYCLSCWKFQVT